MTVVIPGDENEVRQLLPQALRIPGPSYFTVGRYGEPVIPAEEPAVLGKARLLQRGAKVAIFATGEIASEVMKGAEQLRSEGLFPLIYQVHTVKPLDTQTLEAAAREASDFIIVDEHLPTGGLWGGIAAWKATWPQGLRLTRLGPPEAFILGNHRREDLRHRFSFDAAAVVREVRRVWGAKSALRNEIFEREQICRI